MIQYIDHDTSVREEKRVHDELSFPRLVLVPLSRAVDCLLPGNPRCTEYASSSSSSSSTSTPSTYNPLLLSHRSHPPPLAADKLPTGTLWHPPRAPPPFAPCRLQPAPGTTVYRTYVGACALQTVALMPGHCCCHCCYLCCFLVPSQISPLLLLLLLRLILHLLDSRYCSLAPLSPACALPFLYRGCWIVSSSHGFTFPFLRKGLSYMFISLFQFSSFPKFTFHIYILEVSFLRQIWLLFLVTFARFFLVAHGWWYFSLSVLSDFLILFLFFFVIFSLCCFFTPLFSFSLTFLRFSTDIYLYSLYYLTFFLLISIFIIRIFLSSSLLSFPFSSTDFYLLPFDTYLFSLP